MDEIIHRLKGVSALLTAVSEANENTIIENIDLGIGLIIADLRECIAELEALE